MPSFWPWRSNDTSAASFEKELKQLSAKITKTNAQNDRLRQHQRRYKALWTLYTTFAYILVSAILTLVTGWERWSYLEYTTIAASPVLIFGVRTALDAYYNYRISSTQSHLNDLNKEKDQAIDRLKKATKYDSTQQLLEKYGASPTSAQPSPQVKSNKRKSDIGPANPGVAPSGRTGFAPPPTANIPARQPQPRPITPSGPPSTAARAQGEPVGRTIDGPSEEFAPNAFNAPSPISPLAPASQSYAMEGPKWYDRILDVVLGEDETQAKNRIVLICGNCKLVNGQAPPGARTPEDIGRWRCSACHAWNGVESMEKRILKQMSSDAPESPTSPLEMSAISAHEPDMSASSSVQKEQDMDEEDAYASASEEGDTATATDIPPANSTRSKARQRKKA